MQQQKIKRLNELAGKAKTAGLDDSEKLEQQQLRKEYIESVKQSVRNALDQAGIEKIHK